MSGLPLGGGDGRGAHELEEAAHRHPGQLLLLGGREHHLHEPEVEDEVAAGRANHAGSGSWRGLVGNSSVWGTEANNRGTGEMWPDVQIDAYARLCAATCDYSGFTAEMVCRHAEWAPSRKIDPAGPWEDGHDWSRDASHFRALVAQGGTDMPLNDADLFTIGVIVKKALADVGLATLSEQEKRRAAKTRERLARIEAELAED